MALIKRGDIWHVRAQVAGVMIAKSTKTKNKRVAEQLEAKWISEVHSEVVVAGRRPITVGKAIESFLDDRRGSAGYISAENKMRPFYHLKKEQLHSVDTNKLFKHLLSLVEDEGYSINTVNVSIVYWNALQNFCQTSGFTANTKLKKIKGGEGRVRFLSDDEVPQLLAQLSPECEVLKDKRLAAENLDFTLMLLHTGAREQEIAKMRLDQFDLVAGTVTIRRSKGGNDTTLRMSNTVVELVTRRIAAAKTPLEAGQNLHGRTANGYLFPERAAKKTNNDYINRAAKRAGLEDVTAHTMRHTFACRMLRAGLAITEVQHLLGHRNLTSTMCYIHLVPTSTADRAAMVLNS